MKQRSNQGPDTVRRSIVYISNPYPSPRDIPNSDVDRGEMFEHGGRLTQWTAQPVYAKTGSNRSP